MADVDLPRHAAELTVEVVLGQQLVRLGELAALGERRDEDRDRAAGHRPDAVLGEVEDHPRVVLGRRDVAAAQRELGREPRRRRPQPKRTAGDRVVAQPLDRAARLVDTVAVDQDAHGEVVGGPPPRLVEQVVAFSASSASRAQTSASGAPLAVATSAR